MVGKRGVGHNFSFHCFVSQQSWENTPRINPKQKAGKVASSKKKGAQKKIEGKFFSMRGKFMKCPTELEANFCDIYLLSREKKWKETELRELQ